MFIVKILNRKSIITDKVAKSLLFDTSIIQMKFYFWGNTPSKVTIFLKSLQNNSIENANIDHSKNFTWVTEATH